MWLQQQEAVYTATKQQQEARQQYESAIRRPYWHVKPLDAAQLRNWAAYLDWQEAQGDLGLTVRLYERCCVPCASYPGALIADAVCKSADLVAAGCVC
jgi:pre-mRNA-processing factor 39